MSDTRRYATADAFRQALTHRLRAIAGETGWTVSVLQRYVAYDRLLERLSRDGNRWILKGAAALLARDLGVRATVDIDVYRDAARSAAEGDLQSAAARDTDDWFRFDVGRGRDIADAAALRLPVTSYIGDRRWVTFHVDLVGAGIRMTGEPEDVPPLVRLAMPQVEQHGYRAYPLVDHVADKVMATFARHRDVGAPSSRYKDLVDLVAIARGASIDAEALARAVSSLVEQRGITLPDRFDVPDRDAWERGYAVVAGQSLLPAARTLDEALDVVRPFLDPVMNGRATGRWDPLSQRWTRAMAPDREIPARALNTRRTIRARTEGPRLRAGHEAHGHGRSR